jgi:hypothetical protein
MYMRKEAAINWAALARLAGRWGRHAKTWKGFKANVAALHKNKITGIPLAITETSLALLLGRLLGADKMLGAAAAPYGAEVVSKVTDPLANSIENIGDKANASVGKVIKTVTSQQDKLGTAVDKATAPITNAAERLGGALGRGLSSTARGAIFAAGGAGLAGIPTAILTAKYLPGDKNKTLRNVINLFGTAAGGALGLYADSYLKNRAKEVYGSDASSDKTDKTDKAVAEASQPTGGGIPVARSIARQDSVMIPV